MHLEGSLGAVRFVASGHDALEKSLDLRSFATIFGSRRDCVRFFCQVFAGRIIAYRTRFLNGSESNVTFCFGCSRLTRAEASSPVRGDFSEYIFYEMCK